MRIWHEAVIVLAAASLLQAQHAIFLRPVSGGGGAPPRGPHRRIDAFTASGTWTAPAGVTSVTVEAIGGGGAGTDDDQGGGGGGYCRSVVAVTPSTGYPVVRGAGGNGTDGGDSTFDSTTVAALGGLLGSNGGTGGPGGTGDVCFDGGDGEPGTVGSNHLGGGGAGGSAQDGADGSSTNGGIGGNYLAGFGASIGAFPGWPGGGGKGHSSNAIGAPGVVYVEYDIDPGAGYPVVQSWTPGRSAGDTTSHVITMPSGLQAGEYIGVLFANDGSATVSDGSATWTKLCEDVNGTSVRGSFWYKIADGGDSLTITTSASETSSHISFRIRGASGAPTCTAANGSSTNSDPPSHVSPLDGKNLWIAARLADLNGPVGSTTLAQVSAPPANYADMLYVPSGLYTGTDVTVSTRHLDSTDTEDPGTFTSGNEQWVALTIAIPGS